MIVDNNQINHKVYWSVNLAAKWEQLDIYSFTTEFII